MWKLDRSKQFIKQYKHLNSDIRNIVDRALAEITYSDNPADLGVYKSNKRIFAYEIGRKYRIIYAIHYGGGTVELLRVCDHKSVYGKD